MWEGGRRGGVSSKGRGEVRMKEETTVSLNLTRTDIAVIQRALHHYGWCEHSDDWGESGSAIVLKHARGLLGKIGRLTGINYTDVPAELL